MGLIPEHSFAHREDFQNARYRVMLPPGVSYDDLFAPRTWVECRGSLHPYDIVRVIAHDDSFDVELTVVQLSLAGAVMRLRHKMPGDDASPRRMAPAPLGKDGRSIVRLQFTPATKWRLIGLDNQELKRNLTKPEADRELAKYLEEAGLYQGETEHLEEVAL